VLFRLAVKSLHPLQNDSLMSLVGVDLCHRAFVVVETGRKLRAFNNDHEERRYLTDYMYRGTRQDRTINVSEHNMIVGCTTIRVTVGNYLLR
jgi:hypothetical protein